MGNILFTLYGHDGPVTALNFSNCGDYFITGGEDTIVNVWKSNLDSNGEVESLDDLSGMIAVGGLKDTTFKPNIDTYLVSENGKNKSAAYLSPSKARLNTQNSAGSGMGQHYLKSDPSRSDFFSGNKPIFDEMNIIRSPEEEFYRQPARLETIPETAFAKTNLNNVPHEISSTVSKIVNQLDMLSNMLQLLDQRVSSTEAQAKQSLGFFREMTEKEYLMMDQNDDFQAPSTPG